MNDFDKELERLAQKFFNASTGGAYSVDIPKTIEYKDFEKAVKQAIDKYLIGKDEYSFAGDFSYKQMTRNELRVEMRENIGTRRKPGQSLWGAK